VTETLTLPAACAGVTAVIEVEFTTLTLVAPAPPMLTVAPAKKLLPEIVTEVPPAVLPEAGEIEVTVGAGAVAEPDFAIVVVSFFNAPGELFRYVEGESRI